MRQFIDKIINTKIVQKIIEVCTLYSDKRISQYSAEASYYLILSFFPFLMLLLTLVRFIPIDYEGLIKGMVLVIPEAWQQTVLGLINEIFIRTNYSHTILTAVITLWASSGSISSLMSGLNNMYEKDETRIWPLVKLNSLFNTILLEIMVIIMMVLLIFRDILLGILGKHLPDFIFSFISDIIFNKLLIFIVLLVIIMIMYVMLPNRKINIIRELPGALFTALGWYLLSLLFGYYTTGAFTYFYIYGSLATLILGIVWIFFCMNVFYIGAAINCYLEKHYFNPKES